MTPAQPEPDLPVLLDCSGLATFQTVATLERAFLSQAGDLFRDVYYDHALLDLWNAAVCNLRRRAEAYGIELFQSVVKDEPGRKKLDENGETLAERWSGVDDLVLVSGCSRLGPLNKKASKTLEVINWMRNHTTPAHPADETDRALPFDWPQGYDWACANPRPKKKRTFPNQSTGPHLSRTGQIHYCVARAALTELRRSAPGGNDEIDFFDGICGAHQNGGHPTGL